MQSRLKECEPLLEIKMANGLQRWTNRIEGIYEASFDGFDRIIKFDNGAYKWRVFGTINNGPVQFGSERTLDQAITEASKSKY